MKLSKERLNEEASNRQFEPYNLEKVIRLLDLLNQIFADSFLKDRLALKGGTALNLFIFDIPRLSVDVDLNYIGSASREVMLSEKPQLEGLLKGICERADFAVRRQPEQYAGGKWILNYQSALGGGANLELDLNYMFRVNFFPIEKTDSKKIGTFQARRVPVLNIKELVAGKLAALLTRQASRDLFDAEKLMSLVNLADEDRRLAFVLYGALHNKVDWCTLSPDNIRLDKKDLSIKLTPVLKNTNAKNFNSGNYGEELVSKCKKLIAPLFPLRKNEKIFINRLRKDGVIEPSLLTDDPVLSEKIKTHPAILRRAEKAMETLGRKNV